VRPIEPTPSERKDLEKFESGLADLQGVEIAQNGERNPWNGLGKKALDLQRLGKKPWGRGGITEVPGTSLFIPAKAGIQGGGKGQCGRSGFPLSRE
jgi:hypothetical protein